MAEFSFLGNLRPNNTKDNNYKHYKDILKKWFSIVKNRVHTTAIVVLKAPLVLKAITIKA